MYLLKDSKVACRVNHRNKKDVIVLGTHYQLSHINTGSQIILKAQLHALVMGST